MPQRVGNQAAFLSAFKATGSISEASISAKVDRGYHYRQMRSDPAYKAAFDKACHGIVARKSKALQTAAESAKSLREEIRQLRKQFVAFRRIIRREIRDLQAKTQRRAVNKTRRAATPPGKADVLLDQIARGMAKKPFAKLSPPHQDAVRSIAGRMTGEQPD